jgi:hypothetical protein
MLALPIGPAPVRGDRAYAPASLVEEDRAMTRRTCARLGPSLYVLALAVAPARVAALHLLEGDLSLDRPPPPALRVALAVAGPADGPSLDFDLLGEPPKPQVPAEDRSARLRRRMLNWHQALGVGLLGLQLASTTVGQLNYGDKFGIDNTGRYTLSHQVIAYTNLAAFAVTGGIALFAPSAKGPKREGIDRVTVHKIAMGVAAAGMLAQGVLGIQTARREGYLDKQDYGRAHLAIGYATLAAMGVGVGVLVF